jgi:hypothetical protein
MMHKYLQTPGLAAASDLNELLQKQGDDFVECAYLTILKRAADADGLTFYTGSLRRGTPKIQILSELWGSEEAKRVGAHLRGLKQGIRRHSLSKKPLIGAVVRMFFDLERDTVAGRRLRVIEQQTFLAIRLQEAQIAQVDSLTTLVRGLPDRMQNHRAGGSFKDKQVQSSSDGDRTEILSVRSKADVPIMSLLPPETRRHFSKLKDAIAFKIKE